MRQPRIRYFGLAPRRHSSASQPMCVGVLAVVALACGVGLAFFTDTLQAAVIALHAGGFKPAHPPVPPRAGGVPAGIPLALTDASLLHLSLLILAFIEGAFAWVIVISIGQSAAAAPRAPVMDRRLRRPPRVTRVSLARALQLQVNPLPRLLALLARPPRARLVPDRLPLQERGVGAARPRLLLQGLAQKASGLSGPSASQRMVRALPRRAALSSAISPILESVGTPGEWWSVAR